MTAIARRIAGLGTALAAIAGLSGCGPKSTPPPPVVVAPPPQVYIPPRPRPPLGAPASLTIPVANAFGVRQTVNAGISDAQRIWNVRSAYNVAALNCLKPEQAEILNGYKHYLKAHAKQLNAANKAVDADFRKKYGSAFIRPREAYMTQVYNYFASPPTLPGFCDAAVLVARDSLTVKKATDVPAFSERSMLAFEAVFENFYRAFEQYRVDAAAWDARYAPTTAQLPATAATVTAPTTK